MSNIANTFQPLVYLTLYYVVIPSGILYGLWRLWGGDQAQSLVLKSWPRDYSDEEKKKKKQELDKVITYFVVFLIIFLPMWSFSSAMISNNSITTEIAGSAGLHPIYRDPTVDKIGPYFSTGNVIEEMKERPDYWMYEAMDEVIDFDRLTRIPGILTVYRLDGGRQVVTYTYLSPVPMVRAFGFAFGLRGDGSRELIHSAEETYIFPMYPDITGIANP